MLISPVILVRLLSVHEFGMYREFLVYVSVLASIAGFGVNSSLLRFVPDDPQTGWRYVDQVAALTFASLPNAELVSARRSASSVEVTKARPSVD